ncbi:MAG TPA: methyltransferase [Paludibacter sp.]|nr:methyltransferase [Paludibacter sp.]
MPNPYFSFKQFTVYHDKCAMKVGIDGVLLGVWAGIENAHKILDIGTGTGLIALMLAQRSNSTVVGIDIDSDAVLQAKENIRKSPWADRVEVYESSLQEFSLALSTGFDLIVSNPPYFVNSLKAPSESRATARHTDTLTHEELIENAVQLLNPNGRICLILPVNEGLQCVEFATNKGLFCSKLVKIYPKPNAVAKRLLLEFTQVPVERIETELTIESETRHQYSPEFTALAKEFYLKL